MASFRSARRRPSAARSCKNIRSIASAFSRFLDARPELRAFIHDPVATGHSGRHLAAVLSESKLRRVLAKMLDENEFLSPYGIRALSRFHKEHPYVLDVGGHAYTVPYLPAESDTAMFGGNSNWRGPVWMPVNALIIRALLQYYMFYGDEFTIECPTGSGQQMTLYQVAEDLAPAPRRDLPARRKRQTPGLWRHAEVSGRSALARSHPVLRIFSRRQRRRSRCEPSNGLDRHHRTVDASVCDQHRRRIPWTWQSGRRLRGHTDLMKQHALPRVEVASVRYPSLYQINTRALLTELAQASSAADHARRYSGRDARWLRGHGLRLDLVAERMADRSGQPQALALGSSMCFESFPRHCRTCRSRT